MKKKLREELKQAKKNSVAVQHTEEEKFHWVVTATHILGPVRQVYPNEGEAERYADTLRKRKGFKNVVVEQGTPR